MLNDFLFGFAIIGVGYIIYVITSGIGRISDYLEDINASSLSQSLFRMVAKIFTFISCITIVPIFIISLEDLLSRPGYKSFEKELKGDFQKNYDIIRSERDELRRSLDSLEGAYTYALKEDSRLRSEIEDLKSTVAGLNIIIDEKTE